MNHATRETLGCVATVAVVIVFLVQFSIIVRLVEALAACGGLR